MGLQLILLQTMLMALSNLRVNNLAFKQDSQSSSASLPQVTPLSSIVQLLQAAKLLPPIIIKLLQLINSENCLTTLKAVANKHPPNNHLCITSIGSKAASTISIMLSKRLTIPSRSFLLYLSEIE